MNIQLSPEAQRFIDDQLQLGAYRSPSEVIEALIQVSKASQSAADDSTSVRAELAALQRERILQLVAECESLAGAPPADSFTNRDHDRVLYGERS